MNNSILSRTIFDAIASKRIVKTGFVGLPGGIYIHECDTVAAHSNTVAILATIIACEFKHDILIETGIDINEGEIAIMAVFHDYGETKSGDTGAQSKSVFPTESCKLHYLEREGLQTCMQGLKAGNKILEAFDNYRKYSTPEAIIVHIADNLEGFEKAIYSSRGTPAIMDMAFRIMKENIDIYNRKKFQDEALGKVCSLLVDKVLLPGLQKINEAYGYRYSITQKITDLTAATGEFVL